MKTTKKQIADLVITAKGKYNNNSYIVYINNKTYSKELSDPRIYCKNDGSLDLFFTEKEATNKKAFISAVFELENNISELYIREK